MHLGWRYSVPSSLSKEEYDEESERRLDKHRFKTPDTREYYDGDLEVMENHTRTIVRLANIALSPEKPCYLGRRRHVEGLHQQSSVMG